MMKEESILQPYAALNLFLNVLSEDYIQVGMHKIFGLSVWRKNWGMNYHMNILRMK